MCCPLTFKDMKYEEPPHTHTNLSYKAGLMYDNRKTLLKILMLSILEKEQMHTEAFCILRGDIQNSEVVCVFTGCVQCVM